VIAGSFQYGDQTIKGPIQGISTTPVFLDVHLSANTQFDCPLAKELNAFVYIYEGGLDVGDPFKVAPKQAAIVLGEGNQLRVRANTEGAQFIVLAALPLHEPVVQYGPFVMNTRAEIEQAIDDYQNNRFVVSE
jgi:redox-sensitive bicupin YhaK (pirin superfamily)